MSPARVLITTDAVGGVWNYTLDLARGLQARGVTIALAVMGPQPSAAQCAEIAALDHVRLFIGDYALEWMDEPWAEVDAAGDWLLDVAAEFAPDLIHLNGFTHAALPWPAPVLVVAHSCVCGWWRAVKGERAPARCDAYRERVTRGLRAADEVIAPTAAMLTALDEEYDFAAPRRVIVNGRAAHGFFAGEKRPVIFSAGRLWDEAKNLALLTAIASGLSWEVRVAGDPRGPQADQGLRAPAGVTMLGVLSQKQLAHELSEAAIYAAPALYEPFGLSILEAALSGCALVLSDIPSLRELWCEAALFVDPRRPELWRGALNELAENANLRAELAASARVRALHFNLERMTAGYAGVYRELLAAQSAATELAA